MSDICFFPKDISFTCPHEQLAYHILRFNLELHLNSKELLIPRSFSAIFLKKDKLLIENARKVFQIGLEHLVEEFNTNTDFDVQIKSDYLNRVLCLLPYFEFPSDSEITIPHYSHKSQRNLDTWEMIDFSTWITQTYTISKIRLTDSSIWQNPYDRAYAYGLSAQKGNGILVFPGTTYPAGEGFFSHIMTDLDGFRSVGEHLLSSGAINISTWLHEKNIASVFTLGTSLGGSMALQWSLAHPKFCTGVFAFNPPGMLDVPKTPKEETLEEFYNGKLDFNLSGIQEVAQTPTPPARILIQEYDLVSRFGYWHPNWTLIQVKAPTNPFFHRSLFAHALTFVGKKECTYQTLAIADENEKRYWFNLLLFRITRSIIYISIVLPVYYVIKPTWSFIYQELYWIIIASLFLLSIFSYNPIFCIFMGFVIKEFMKLPFEPFQAENLYFIMLSLLTLASYFFIAKSLPILLVPMIAYVFTQFFTNLLNDEPELPKNTTPA